MSKNTDNNMKYTNLDTSYYVYILKCSDGTLYTGITNDLKRRLDMHNSGVASKYTKSRLPVSYVYIESGLNKSNALKRESAIKKLSRAEKLDLIADPSANEFNGSLPC